MKKHLSKPPIEDDPDDIVISDDDNPYITQSSDIIPEKLRKEIELERKRMNDTFAIQGYKILLEIQAKQFAWLQHHYDSMLAASSRRKTKRQ